MILRFRALAASALLAGLAACGGEAPAADHSGDVLPNGMTAKQQIETRQKNLKDLAAAFKVVNDQLKTDAPALDQIRPAVQTIKTHASEIGTWFPEKSGPESGVETAALPKIWEDNATFQAAAARLVGEAGKLSDVASGEDVEAIRVQAQATGAACKNCHDSFRKKKE
jgi:cytochrome c556